MVVLAFGAMFLFVSRPLCFMAPLYAAICRHTGPNDNHVMETILSAATGWTSSPADRHPDRADLA